MSTSFGSTKRSVWKPTFPCQGQQEWHDRWIWGLHCMQVTKHESEGILPGFETQGKCHHKSKTGVFMAQQKGFMPFRTLKTIFRRSVLVLLTFWQFSSELTQTWSSGTTECRVWIGNCNVKLWKSTGHKLQNIWRSIKFQQNEHTHGDYLCQRRRCLWWEKLLTFGQFFTAYPGVCSFCWKFCTLLVSARFCGACARKFFLLLHWDCLFKLHFLWRLNSQFLWVQLKIFTYSGKRAHSEKPEYKDLTGEQCYNARIFKVNCCLKVHNAPLKLALLIF